MCLMLISKYYKYYIIRRRLELLDLSENKIELIENVERLIALKALNLG